MFSFHSSARRFLAAALLFQGIAWSPLPLAASGDDEARLHPLAILQRECVSCHTETRRRGGLLIDSRESLLEGGDTEAAIVPGKSAESFLVETLYPDGDPHMPPKSQLDPREIQALEEWINAGAPWDAELWVSLNMPERGEVEFADFPADYDPIFALALSPDGTRLAVGRGPHIDWYAVNAPEAAEGEEEKPAEGFEIEYLRTLSAHRDAVQSLAFSPDGATLVSGGFRALLFWDGVEPSEPIERVEEPFLGRQTALLFLGEPERLLVADSLPAQLGRLHEIDLATREIRSFDAAHLDTIFSLVASPDSKHYATASADRLATVRDASTHEILTRLEGHTGYILSLAFSPEGERIASAGDDEEVKVWEIDSGKKVTGFTIRRSGPVYGLAWLVDPANEAKREAEKDEAKAAEINTDRVLAVAQSGRAAAFTELKVHEGTERSTGAKENAYDAAEGALLALAVAPESGWTFAGGFASRLFVWDEQGKLKFTLDPPEREVSSEAVASR